MTTKTIAAEEYLCQLQLEILRLREVVSGLYRAGEEVGQHGTAAASL